MSGAKRVFRKIERTPEEKAELKAERERFSLACPDLSEIVATGDYDGPHRQGDILAFLSAVAALKRRRHQRGLSLTDVAKRSALERGMLSKLENGKILNPTMATLWRYAAAVNARLTFAIEPLPVGADS